MRYDEIVLGRFLSRPNRFFARVDIDGRAESCHVKNTSRLGELLLPDAVVSLQKARAPGRKTAYDLIAVQHAGIWVNIDSLAPNRVFGEWVWGSEEFAGLSHLRAETTYGHSRFDFYAEAGARRIFIEVKGVTLVEDGVARFPGAPTTRGVKHLRELGHCVDEGYEAVLVFVVARQDVAACGPNDAMDAAFGRALREAAAHGVRLLGLGCRATPESLEVDRRVEIVL